MLEMLSYAFMQRALLAGLMVAVIGPAIGLFLVLRHLGQYSDTLAHVSLAGVAAGSMLRTQPLLGGLAFSVLVSLGIDWLRRRYARYSELALAVMAPASLGLAVLLLSLSDQPGSQVLSYLFGSIVTVTRENLIMVGTLGSLVLAVLLLLHKELFSITFDEEHARISGLPVPMINCVFMVLTAMSVAMAMSVVGVLLVSGLMVIPVAAGLQLARSFRGALLISVAVGVLSVLMGLTAAYYLNIAPGGTVVLTAAAILLLVLLWKRIRRLE
ncbi:MAG TPA: metal ABC transporter permease [Symbiobacteriaceae bacterium]